MKGGCATINLACAFITTQKKSLLTESQKKKKENQQKQVSDIATHVKYLVYDDMISSLLKLTSWEPISCKYRQSRLLQG